MESMRSPALKYLKLLLWTVTLVPVLAGCMTAGAPSEDAVIRAKEKVAPALVHIRPVKEVFRQGQREEVLITGSGFIISPDGYVVTNEHVAGRSSSVRCVLGNKDEVSAKVIGVDPATDIAVLKLDTDRHDLPFAKLGRSANLRAGETVLALGSPHGLARSVSAGIVSVTDRYLAEANGRSISPYNNWIQTDAAINPGNSGGPLINLRGEVIGINTRAMRAADNIGFAIPIDIAKEVIDKIIADGKVARSTIGVEFQEMLQKTEDPNARGVVIADVDPLSPARRAGLRPGDVLLNINGRPTDARFEEDLTRVRKLIADVPVGEEIALLVQRGNEQVEVRLNTIEKRELEGEEIEFTEWGFTVSELTPEIVRRAQLDSAKGVVITGVQVGGLAANARLAPGDIIVEMDEQPVEDLPAFKTMYRALVESRKPLVLFLVKRSALTQFLILKQAGALSTDGGTAQ